MRIRKGDTVIVRSGKYKGHRSDVISTMPSTDKVVVEGVNVAKRSTKPRRATMQGGIIDKFMPLPAAAVSLWCNAHGGAARLGIEFDEQGRKTRVCRKCGAEL